MITYVDMQTPGEFVIIDRSTGQDLTKVKKIVEANAEQGWYVEIVDKFDWQKGSWFEHIKRRANILILRRGNGIDV